MKIFKFLVTIGLLTYIHAGSTSAQAESGSTLAYSGDLYRNGRPQTGEFGTVRDFAAWRNYLYVSWADLDGDFWLDTWDLSNISAPEALASTYFGNSNDDAGAFIPVAHLKAPRDMGVVDGHLVLWTALGVNIYPLGSEGNLGELVRFAPQDREDGVNRITIRGNYASTQRRRLSDAEVTALLNQSVPLSQIEALLNGIALINLQNPGNPFLSLANQNVGANFLSLASAPIGTLAGVPALGVLSNDNTQLDLTKFTQKRSEHFSSFWDSKLRKVIRRGSYSMSLEAVSNKIANRKFVKGEIATVLAALKKGVRAKDSLSLKAAVKKRYQGTASLRSALDDFSVERTDSLELMLRKIALSQISQKVSTKASRALLKKLAGRWYETIFALKDITPTRLAGEVTSIMNGELEAQGVSSYLVRRVLAPLVDIPPELLLSLGELIDLITNNQVAAAIDAALDIYHTFFPASGLLTLVGFDVPQCLDIPRNSKDLLELLLINSGPQLDRSELALFELLRLAQYYLGNTDLSGFVAELRRSVRDLHVDLSGEFVSSFVRPFAGVGEFTGKISKAVQGVTVQVDLRSVLADILVQGVVRQLTSKGVDVSVSVESYFDARADAGRGADFDSASIDDLLLALSDLKLSNTTVGTLYARAEKAGANLLISALRSTASELLEQVVGKQAKTVALGDALEALVESQMDPNIFGEFVGNTLGQVLSARQAGTSLPDIIGIAALVNQSDCVSRWRFAIVAAEAASAVLQLDALTAAFVTVENALVNALDSAIGYVLRSLIQQFVDEVFSERAESYESWYSNIVAATSSVDLAAFGIASTRFGTVAAAGDRVAVILRNGGASLPTPELSEVVQLVRFNPESVAASMETISLGEFSLVNSVLPVGDAFLIVGNAASGEFFGASAAQLVQFAHGDVVVRKLLGDDASLLSAATKAIAVRNGNATGVLNGGGYIVFVN